MYIRFRHVVTMFGNCPRMRSLNRLNLASFIIGMITVLGVSIVGNFQVHYRTSKQCFIETFFEKSLSVPFVTVFIF